MIKGQCLCGAVQYQYSAEIEKSILCYCQDCQQAQGSIAGWNSPIEKINFELSGIEYLQEYFHTANKARVFCKVCASPLYSYRLDLPEFIRLRLGTVTEGNIPAPTEEYFIEHKPEFIVISSS
ncbi:GFA family protein [Acinetobacter sp. WU_MDCI_Axc73]|nr:GFA family protein [Acinetobacter sp. WU_MDCI_Axc73]